MRDYSLLPGPAHGGERGFADRKPLVEVARRYYCARCSRRIARRAAARSSASSSRVEEMNARTRWSGVKITSVSAITSQASPQPCGHEDHLRLAVSRAAGLAPAATRPHHHQFICSPAGQWPKPANPCPSREQRAQAGQRRQLVSLARRHSGTDPPVPGTPIASPAPGGRRFQAVSERRLISQSVTEQSSSRPLPSGRQASAWATRIRPGRGIPPRAAR